MKDSSFIEKTFRAATDGMTNADIAVLVVYATDVVVELAQLLLIGR